MQLTESTIDMMETALKAAWLDIKQWLQLAKYQQQVIPDYSNCQHAPTDAAIQSSQRIISQIQEAIAAYVKEQSQSKLVKIEVPSRPECTFQYCPKVGGCPTACQYPLAKD